ncbi:MAG: DUF1501 domain-containing protein [Verrucomicrobiales bacterium]|nr:DUF1501 domain-containing protein [Verrucomicrobiales bacterium]
MTSTEATRQGCPEFRRLLAMERRSFLKAGVLGLAGLSLGDLLRWEARAAVQRKQTKRENSVIILWMRGGPSQHETWDPKPDAPLEYRGEFGAMSTSVPGIQICDLLPMSAKIMHKWSIVRSLHHTDAGHSTGDQICFTGYPSAPDLPAEGPGNTMPSCGSVVAKQLQQRNPKLPAYVIIPRIVPGTGSAYLGRGCDPFETIADPAKSSDFKIPNFALPAGVSLQRLENRRSLLESMDGLRRELDHSGQMASMDQFQQRAWDILSGNEARAAFNLEAEPREVRERYGFIPEFKAPTPDRCGVPAWSQRFVLARRLVEAGVRLVTVDCRWWDTHVQGFDTMRNGFLPRWDRAYSALIEDLDQRGLLETTMVVAWGEFGRTPKVNAQAGRDHWPNVFSAALAGGGIQGGRVVGSSDKTGAEPAENPKTPQDVLATLYRHLGIDLTAQYTDHSGRPHPVLPSGKPIDEFFS